MVKKYPLVLLLVFLLLPSLCLGATVYVDNSITDCTTYSPDTRTCDGGSSQSYNTFSNAFTNEDFGPGDTLYVRSGTYPVTISPGANDNGSTSGRFIVSAYSNEQVIVRPSGSGMCINGTGGASYITFDGIYCDMNESSGGAMKFMGGSGHVIVKNCSVVNLTGYGIKFDTSSDGVADNNAIITKEGSWELQSDLLNAYNGADNTVFSNNYLVQRNSSPTQRCDGIEAAFNHNITIYNNYIEQNNTATNHKHFIILESSTGQAKIYNNILYKGSGSTGSHAIDINSSSWDIYIFNNTEIISGCASGISLQGTSGAYYIQNNILSFENNVTSIYGIPSGADRSNIHHNLFNPNGVSGTGGYNIVGEAPEINSNFMPISSTANVVDSGTTLSSEYSVDILGISRPVGSAWDMGAHEFYEGGDSAKPMPPGDFLKIE